MPRMEESPINIFSTIRTGLIDGTNVGGITQVLIFIVFLYIAAVWAPRYLRWLGSGFIVGSAMTTTLINLSFFDNIIFSRDFDIFLQVAHFILEIASLAVGLILLRDWWVYSRSDDKRKLLVKYPFLDKPSDSRPWSLLGKLLFFAVAYLCGAGSAFLISAWPGDQRYFSILLYRIYLPGMQWPALLWGLFCGLMFNFYLILALVGFRKALKTAKIKDSLQRSLTKVQIVFSAVFLAYGGVMIYIYYIRFYFKNLV